MEKKRESTIVSFGNTTMRKSKLIGINKTQFKEIFKGVNIGMKIDAAWKIAEPFAKVKSKTKVEEEK